MVRFTKKEIYAELKKYNVENYTEKVYKRLLTEGKYWFRSVIQYGKTNAILTEYDNIINKEEQRNWRKWKIKKYGLVD